MLQISQYLNLQTFTKGAIFYINISLHISGHLYFKAPFRDYVLSSLLLACMIIIATSADFMLLTHKLLIFCNEDFCQIANIYFIISRLWNPLRAIYITILHYT